MSIEQIREELSDKLQFELEWTNYLDDSNPGHHGVKDWDVRVDPNDIWVDVPKRTFNFKNATFHFDLYIGASNEEDGTIMSFTKQATGDGTFEFTNKSKSVEVTNLNVEYDLDLFGDDR